MSGIQAVLPKAIRQNGGPDELSASMGFFDRLCFWQRIFGTGSEGAVLK